jgi:cbb3-type cytochrome oxidase subunit 3
MNVEEDVKASMKLSKMMFFLAIYIHFYACIWWMLCKYDEEWVAPLHMPTSDMY